MLAGRYDTDVLVVGGGPAGLAAAIAARLRGLNATVADGAQPLLDKACGDGLMPDSFPALHRLGIQINPDESYGFRGIRFRGVGASVEADFPGGTGLGIRRPLLHRALMNRAAEAGVSMLWGQRVIGLAEDGVALDGRQIRCRWVIGADGQNSRVRRWAGLDDASRATCRVGFRRHYRISPWTNYMEIYWGCGSQIYVTPVHPSEVCVVLITRDAHLRLEQALPQFPELNVRLKGALPTTAERGAVTASRRLRRVFQGGIVLIGDASGSVDAITGEGMSLAFHQAIALADALASGKIADYQAEHRRLARRPAFMAQLMLSMDRFPWLRRRVLRALASEPAIFGSLLAMHVGSISPVDFLRHGMVPLGRQILTAS